MVGYLRVNHGQRLISGHLLISSLMVNDEQGWYSYVLDQQVAVGWRLITA